MANVYLYELTDLWNNANITFDSIRMVVDDVASQTDSTFLKFAISTNTNARFVIFKTGDIHIGNTTVNIQSNGTLFKIANSSLSINLSLSGLTFGSIVINTTSLASGANSFLDTTKLSLGNSTVNAVLNSESLIFSGNLNLTSSELKVGNTTVNTTVNSSLVFTTGSLRFGTFVANTTATLTGYLSVFDAGGTERKIMVFV